MTQPFPTRTAGRIKWFSQLSAALDEAQHLLRELSLQGGESAEASMARTQVLALSSEIELLRSEGFLGQRRITADPLVPNWRGGR